MTKTEHFKHAAATLLLAAAAGVVELLTNGAWSHTAWAPAVVVVLKWAIQIGGATSGPAASAVLLASALALHGCAHAPPGPVTTFGHCTSDALKQAANSILGRIMTALATGDYVDQLAALATQFGTDEVGCAVDLAIAELRGMHASSPDVTVATMLERAQAWRGAHP